MHQPVLPNLAKLNEQLAGSLFRVERFIDSLPGHAENLLAAASIEDWADVRRQSEYLQTACRDYNLQSLSELAADLQQAIIADNVLLARRNVAKLVSHCGKQQSAQRKAT